MYRLMAIAKYDERYVIPTAHVEQAHELEELGCSLDFDGGPDMQESAPSARPVAARSRWRSRPSTRCGDGRPPRCRRPARPPCTVGSNLLNWDGRGAPGLFPEKHPPPVGERREPAPAGGLSRGAWCLAYPDEDLIGRVPLIAVGAGRVPRRPRRTSLTRPGHSCDPRRRWSCQTHYVETSTWQAPRPHLSYWTDGDTRRRGEVLAAFKERYRRSGPRRHRRRTARLPADGAGVRGGRGPGRRPALLQRFRGSLELLRFGLLPATELAVRRVSCRPSAPRCPGRHPPTAGRACRWPAAVRPRDGRAGAVRSATAALKGA